MYSHTIHASVLGMTMVVLHPELNMCVGGIGLENGGKTQK